MDKRIAVIIGAGPAGLTAAYELLTRSDVMPIVLEKSEYMGGISRTVNYKNNRIDIGGHRFFSKSDRVMEWWLKHMPMEARAGGPEQITYHQMTREVNGTGQGPDATRTDSVMLVRERKSRIYFMRRFFEYPIRLSKDTLAKLGAVRVVRIGLSYMKSSAFPIRNEKTLEQFFINRFGRELYLTFFKSYTEKVWGVPCDKISAEWGAQRVKGLSVAKTILHALKKAMGGSKGGGSKGDVRQKETETSLIEQFLYPKYGPGQMWEEVAREVTEMGGEIRTGWEVRRLFTEGDRVVGVEAYHPESGRVERIDGDFIFSTMPMQELMRSLDAEKPKNALEVSEGLIYRDFITVGLLVNKLKITEVGERGPQLVRDNWIYIQEPDVQVGRLQIFNNWSPYLVSDPSKVWIGLEYFCNETDPLWRLPDEEMVQLGKDELARIDILEPAEVLDATVIRVPKTYPAYFGTYDRFEELRAYLDGFQNLFLVGRNGMHKYNNQDHSMLTAMTAVDNIIEGRTDKSNIWAVNTEQEYHEETKSSEPGKEPAQAAATA